MNHAEEFNPDEWVIDRNNTTALSIRIKERLFCEKSPYQTVEVFTTCDRGKMLTIDRMVMCTEVDEASYHEMLVHVPMLSRPSQALPDSNIKDILVIGGGDGGTVRELVRYDQIETITMVEIDEVVVRAAKQFLPTIAVALEHPKLELLIDDGIKFVKEAADDSYDLVIIDSSDPVGPAEGLFTQGFYQDVYRCLRSEGLVTVQSESPTFNPKAFVELNQCLKQVFGKEKVYPYLVFIPMYPSGMWSLTYCTKSELSPLSFNRDRASQFTQKHDLKYYNLAVHQSAFALPTSIQKML
ncbi:MAG TPA: polyamine aminopropyltransferase [Xenococcaceae cyanobacterium]|jgi:spermidine synthase